EALAPVELVDGVLEAQVALLDQVEELHARGEGVATGDADHQAQVGPDEAVLRGGGVAHRLLQLAAGLTGFEAGASLHALLDDLRELALLRGGEEGHGSDLVEVLADGITHVFAAPTWPTPRSAHLWGWGEERRGASACSGRALSMGATPPT